MSTITSSELLSHSSIKFPHFFNNTNSKVSRKTHGFTGFDKKIKINQKLSSFRTSTKPGIKANTASTKLFSGSKNAFHNQSNTHDFSINYDENKNIMKTLTTMETNSLQHFKFLTNSVCNSDVLDNLVDTKNKFHSGSNYYSTGENALQNNIYNRKFPNLQKNLRELPSLNNNN